MHGETEPASKKVKTLLDIKKNFKSEDEFEEWLEEHGLDPNIEYTFFEGGDSKNLPKIDKKYRKFLEEIDKELKKFEPHDLSKAEEIYNEAIEAFTLKTKGKKAQKTKIKYLTLALETIERIIKNSIAGFQFLEKEQAISFDVAEFWTEVEQAENFRKQLEIMVRDLQPVKLVDTDNWTIEEVADYTGISESTLNHLPPEEAIPYVLVGTRKIYRKESVDRWMAEREVYAKKLRVRKGKSRFSFKIPLEPFTNVFVENGYLDADNAILMNDRFSENPKDTETKIKWEKSLRSLLTFIYLSDRLDYYIDRSNFRNHDNSFKKAEETGTIQEENEEGKEVPFQVLTIGNFITSFGGKSEATISRVWKKINNDIIELSKQIVNRRNQRIKRPCMTRKEVLEYYFENKNKERFKLNTNKDTDIDTKMLELVGKIHKENFATR